MGDGGVSFVPASPPGFPARASLGLGLSAPGRGVHPACEWTHNTLSQGDTRMAKSTHKPVHTIRLGRVKAAIWANTTDMGIRHNVTVQRLYKKDDQWLSTDSFGRDDLPLVCKVMSLAHTWLYEKHEPAEAAAKAAKPKAKQPEEPDDGDEPEVADDIDDQGDDIPV